MSLSRLCWDKSGFPDRSYFACVDAHNPHDPTTSLWLFPSTGGEPIAVTNGSSRDWSPSWSSDGRRLFFVSNRGGSMDLWQQCIGDQGPVRAPEPLTVGVGMRSTAFLPTGRSSLTPGAGWCRTCGAYVYCATVRSAGTMLSSSPQASQAPSSATSSRVKKMSKASWKSSLVIARLASCATLRAMSRSFSQLLPGMSFLQIGRLLVKADYTVEIEEQGADVFHASRNSYSQSETNKNRISRSRSGSMTNLFRDNYLDIHRFDNAA